MSFPKAKIHRFNEEMTCAPPPGKYDPKFDTKVKGAVIEKSKRFIEPKLSSASSTESIDSVGKSNGNVSLLPVFRTPQLKRSYLKTPKSVPASYHVVSGSAVNVRRNLDNEALSSDNLTSRLKNENCALSAQLQQKNAEVEKLNEKLNELEVTANEEQEKIKEEHKIIETIHRKEIQNLSDEIDQLKNKIDEEQERHFIELEELAAETKSKIESMTLADNETIRSIETEFDSFKMRIELDFKVKFNDICEEMQTQVGNIGAKVETTVNEVHEMESEFKKKSEELSKLIVDTNSKLEQVLKDLVTVNAEKDELKLENSEQKSALEESNCKISNLEKQLAYIDAELMQSKQTCKKFHVATMEHRKTIEALSIRLYESESEVERLNSVQHDLENQKVLLEGKAENLVMEIINLRESMKYLESEIIRDVEEIKTQLTAKVDSYRIKAAEETKALLEAVEEKQRTIDMLVTEIDYYRNRLTETDAYVNNIRNKSEQYTVEISQLKMKLSEAEGEFTERINAQKNVYAILDGNYKEKCETVLKLQQIKADQDQHISELVEKLDHQSECAQRATVQINGLTNENAAKDKQIENLIMKLDTNNECVKTISKHVENMMAQMESKDKQIQVLHQDLETKLSALISLTNENDDLKNKLDEKIQHIEELEKEMRETHKDNEKYVDELISEIVLEKERGSELAAHVSQLEEEKIKNEDEMKKLLVENEDLVCKCSSLDGELKKITEVVNSEKEESSRLLQLLNEHENNKQALEEKLQKENIEKAQLILELSTKIDNLEDLLKKADELKLSVEKENGTLKLQLQSAQERIIDLENVNEATKSKVEELNKRVEEITGELLKRTSDMEKFHMEVDMSKFEDAVAGLKEEIVVLCDNIDAKEKMVAELSLAKSKLEDELSKSACKHSEEVKQLEMQIQNEREKNSELSDSYTKMENRKNEYKLYSVKVTDEVDHLKDQLKKLQEEKTKVENEKKQLEIMIGPFMKQLRDYEEERNQLATKKDAIEGELYALERKYAQSLGHQNLKQKIHYVSRLKEENIQLKQTIEQLSTENIRLKNKCKDLEIATRENSPRTAKKSINKERVHSPNILKDRNQL